MNHGILGILCVCLCVCVAPTMSVHIPRAKSVGGDGVGVVSGPHCRQARAGVHGGSGEDTQNEWVSVRVSFSVCFDCTVGCCGGVLLACSHFNTTRGATAIDSDDDLEIVFCIWVNYIALFTTTRVSKMLDSCALVVFCTSNFTHDYHNMVLEPRLYTWTAKCCSVSHMQSMTIQTLVSCGGQCSKHFSWWPWLLDRSTISRGFLKWGESFRGGKSQGVPLCSPGSGLSQTLFTLMSLLLYIYRNHCNENHSFPSRNLHNLIFLSPMLHSSKPLKGRTLQVLGPAIIFISQPTTFISWTARFQTLSRVIVLLLIILPLSVLLLCMIYTKPVAKQHEL